MYSYGHDYILDNYHYRVTMFVESFEADDDIYLMLNFFLSRGLLKKFVE